MKIAILSLLLASCGTAANPCATKGATYIQRYAQTSGNCGALPDQVVNISADGSIPAAANVTCDKYESDGCAQRNTNCRGPAVDGVTCAVTSSVTFASDGRSASGQASVTCTGTQQCAGSYSITAIRQP